MVLLPITTRLELAPRPARLLILTLWKPFKLVRRATQVKLTFPTLTCPTSLWSKRRSVAGVAIVFLPCVKTDRKCLVLLGLMGWPTTSRGSGALFSVQSVPPNLLRGLLQRK